MTLGFFDPFLSQTSHDGVDICILSAALTKPVYSKIISKYFDTSINTKDSLSLVNTAFAKEGVYVHIPKNKILDKKINLKIPVTMIHGSNDTTVPISLSRKVLKLFNNAKKKLLIIKNGDHSLFSKKLQKKIVRELDFFL